MTSKKRISVELTGDEALTAETLITALQIKSPSKKENDTRLINLSLSVLEMVLDDCRAETGKKFPTEDDLRDFLVNKDRKDVNSN